MHSLPISYACRPYESLVFGMSASFAVCVLQLHLQLAALETLLPSKRYLKNALKLLMFTI